MAAGERDEARDRALRGAVMERATKAQIAYAEKLLRELGYDVEDYPLSEMSKREASRLIDDLKDELYG